MGSQKDGVMMGNFLSQDLAGSNPMKGSAFDYAPSIQTTDMSTHDTPNFEGMPRSFSPPLSLRVVIAHLCYHQRRP
jgi:hypothetical protein